MAARPIRVDHIIPLAIINDACPMDKTGRLQAFRMAMDLNNLQMIPGVENMSKGMSFDDPQQRGLFDVLSIRYLPQAKCNILFGL